MVQISTSLIIAAAVVPALAAPVLDTREPFNVGTIRKIAKLGGKVVSGASLAATVAPLVQQRDLETDDLEAREPITSAQVKTFAKGASQIAHHAQNGIEFGAAVAPLFPQKQRRSLEDLEARKFHVSSSTLKMGGGAAAAAAGFAGTVALMNTQPHQRDFDEIYTRAYDDAELDAREPKFNFGKVFGKVAGVASNFIRDDETGDIYARDPKFNFGKVFGKVAGVASNFIRDDETSDVYVRDPKFNFGKVFGKVAGVASNFIRDDETGEVYVREYDDAELDARDPKFNFGKVFGKVAGVASNFIRDDETGDIYVRDPKFNFGKVFGKVAGVASNFIRETPQIDELD